MPYPEELVAPMRKELVDAGVQELRDPAAVDEFLSQKTGTAMVVVGDETMRSLSTTTSALP